MNAIRPPIVSVPCTTLNPPSSSTATSDRFGRKLSCVHSSERDWIPFRLVARSRRAWSSNRFCISGMRPNALMILTPVAISSMIVVRSPCWSCSCRAMTLYFSWNLLLKNAMGSMQTTTTTASFQSSCAIRTNTTANVTMVCMNQMRPKATNLRTVPMSAIARDSSWPDCQLSWNPTCRFWRWA